MTCCIEIDCKSPKVLRVWNSFANISVQANGGYSFSYPTTKWGHNNQSRNPATFALWKDTWVWILLNSTNTFTSYSCEACKKKNVSAIWLVQFEKLPEFLLIGRQTPAAVFDQVYELPPTLLRLEHFLDLSSVCPSRPYKLSSVLCHQGSMVPSVALVQPSSKKPRKAQEGVLLIEFLPSPQWRFLVKHTPYLIFCLIRKPNLRPHNLMERIFIWDLKCGELTPMCSAATRCTRPLYCVCPYCCWLDVYRWCSSNGGGQRRCVIMQLLDICDIFTEWFVVLF